MSEEKIPEDKYDVFLWYNHEDEPRVKEISRQLEKKGIAPWLYSRDIRPGMPRQREIDQQIRLAPSAAVFVGASGISLRDELQVDALMREYIERKCPVFPVLLEDAPDILKLPLLLDGMKKIDFRVLKENRELPPDEEPLNRLILGITEKRVWRNQRHVLIASLGDSPVVVSAMYDLLTKKEGITIDQVIVLRPNDKDVGSAYELLMEALPDKCWLWALPFEDANSWTNACLFLKELYRLLDTCQVRGDTVYLSLAGGRKSMAALMAWIAPVFSCVEHLYHVIDPNEDHFLSINDLYLNLSSADRKAAMHPDLESLIPVDIPFEPGQQIDQQRISHLLAVTEDELERMQYEEAETASFMRDIAYAGKILEARVTQRVLEQFHMLCQHDRDAARRVRECLERMRYTVELRNIQPDSFPYKDKPTKPAKTTGVDLHLFKSFGTPVQSVFYTCPKDIYIAAWDDEVEQVVICELEMGEDGKYRGLQEIALSPGFSSRPAERLEKLPYVPPSGAVDSVLVVPLGKFPMVATQLYTLLKHQEGHNIREVILVYPEMSTEIANGADLIERALQEEANVSCTHATVSGLKDIDSTDACRSYQATLEKVIDQVSETHKDCIIDLALSGGRKGMTAMTVFAAQKKLLPYIYHTLITDEQLSEAIDEQTTVEALNDLDLSSEERNDRLFLRAYESEGSDPRFILFKVPLFAAHAL